MPYADQEHGVQLRLRKYLGARLGPLAVLLVVVVCLSAPIAFFVLSRRALRVQAEATAQQIAAVIRSDAQQRPTLWRYDTVKLLSHVRTYEVYEGIERVDVVDVDGRRIDAREPLPAELEQRPIVWAMAPIEVSGDEVGAVWVAVSMTEIRLDALMLLLSFAVLGSLLGGLMYWLPMRAIGRAEDDIEALLRRLEDSQAALATLNENLEQQVEDRSSALREANTVLERKERNLRELSARAVKLQEAERRGIARELHDSAGQALTAIRIQLQLMETLLQKDRGRDDDKVYELAAKTMGMVDRCVEEIRRAVNQLGPAVLDDVGLEQAVARAADDLREATGIEIQAHVDLPGRLDASIETTAYRLLQEALTNVARHAQAQHVDLEVFVEGDRLLVRVHDDGAGFDPSQRSTTSRGLRGMRERVALIGGELEINSVPGQGTQLEARIPLFAAG